MLRLKTEQQKVPLDLEVLYSECDVRCVEIEYCHNGRAADCELNRFARFDSSEPLIALQISWEYSAIDRIDDEVEVRTWSPGCAVAQPSKVSVSNR
jgi:hypothetical protein